MLPGNICMQFCDQIFLHFSGFKLSLHGHADVDQSAGVDQEQTEAEVCFVLNTGTRMREQFSRFLEYAYYMCRDVHMRAPKECQCTQGYQKTAKSISFDLTMRLNKRK